MKTRILLVADAADPNKEAYVRAICAAGGEAVFPGTDEAPCPSCAGLVLGGEADALLPCTAAALARDGSPEDREAVAQARAYLEYGLPVLGIGRGALLLTLALGGELWQGLPGGLPHVREGGGDTTHPVCSENGSLLYDLYDTRFLVNSCHRQVVRRVGCGVSPTACAPDGRVEAYEHARSPVLAVQWHPERCLEGEGGLAPGLPLFRYFLLLCQERAEALAPPPYVSPDVRFACGLIGEYE